MGQKKLQMNLKIQTKMSFKVRKNLLMLTKQEQCFEVVQEVLQDLQVSAQ